MQWLGDGVITIEKKDYGLGDEIPENKLSKARAKKLTEDGLLGDTPKASGKTKSDPAVAAANVKLADENEKLTSANEKLTENVDELNGVVDDYKGLEKEFSKLKRTNENMLKHIKAKTTDKALKELNDSLDEEVQQLTSEIEDYKKQLKAKE